MLKRLLAASGVCVFVLGALGGTSVVSAQRPQLCTLIPPADVAAITGGTYESTEQQADYANLAHCGYLGGGSSADSVSILFASGDTASQRWEQSKMFNPQPVEGFLDKASWEPTRGTLSAVSGEKFAEVRVSKSHGEEEARIDVAKKLVELLFTKL